MLARLCLVSVVALLLAGCEIPGIYPDPKIVQREADAKATGSGCRHALRGLEDCYTTNPKAPRASVFTGWKDMDQYMRDNKIEGSRSTAVIDAEAEQQSVASTKDKTVPEPRDRRSTKSKAS